MTKYKYDIKFNERLKQKRKKEEKDKAKNEKNKVIKFIRHFNARFSDYRKIQFYIAIFSLFLTIFTFGSLYTIRNSSQGNIYILSAFLTWGYIISLIYLRGFLLKILFIYKRSMMDLYYREYNSLVPSSSEVIYIPISDNGKVIGILESMLFGFGILVQSYTLIGFVLAIRSYVSLTSHKNKEESEFYIIGLMGSLLLSIAITGIYILLIYLITNQSILRLISNYISNIS